jgi:RNA polymerase sigma-70 factor, ECF subfamily
VHPPLAWPGPSAILLESDPVAAAPIPTTFRERRPDKERRALYLRFCLPPSEGYCILPGFPKDSEFTVAMTTEPDPSANDLLITGDLVTRAKRGDREALDTLMARYRPRLERWASGRLPGSARSLLDTGDLVQETLIKALEGLDRFEVRGPGVFQAYVRQAILNRIKDQVRWARRRPGAEVTEQIEDTTPSPLELAIGIDILDRYERAMARLDEDERRLIHFRVELDISYEEIAAITERSSPDAARKATQRAMRKLAGLMGHER